MAVGLKPFQNMFGAIGEKVPEPFSRCRSAFLVIDRKRRAVKIQSRRPSEKAAFSWPLPTAMSADALNAVASYAAESANRLLSGDARPEARYELELALLRRIAAAEALDGGIHHARSNGVIHTA